MGKIITCVSESSYELALTRGKQYEVIEENESKVRLCGDNGRTRWYSTICFDMDGNPAPNLVRWKFDDPTDEEPEMIVEATMQFNDGKYRWSLLATPTSLKNILEDRHSEPGIWATHLIVVRSLNPVDVGVYLRELERHGDLLEASRPINYEAGNEPDFDGNTYEWHAAIPKPTS